MGFARAKVHTRGERLSKEESSKAEKERLLKDKNVSEQVSFVWQKAV